MMQTYPSTANKWEELEKITEKEDENNGSK